MSLIAFIIAFIICLSSYSLHTYTHYLEHKGKAVPSALNEYFHKIVHSGYYAWIIMLVCDPYKIGLPFLVRLIGGIIGTIGLYFMLESRRKRNIANKDDLITTGVYSIFRHPMYIGMALMYLFYPLATGSILTFASAIIWISQMFIWTYWEEIELFNKFGIRYSTYKNKFRGPF